VSVSGAPAPYRQHPNRPWWLLLGVVAGSLAVVALLLAGITILSAPPESTPAALQLPARTDLDQRWGTYLLEREWGTPREAVGDNGWALTWRGAIATDYKFGEDGIAGFSDQNEEFRLGWAFWDGAADHVTERFDGLGNPAGPAGEQITDDRVFHENDPEHAYDRLTYRYPRTEKWFSIDLVAARYDSASMTFVATVTNTTSDTRSLDVVFKSWMAPTGTVDPMTNGLLMRGTDSVVAVIGQPPSEWQISPDKGALDANLRTGELAGDQGGTIGALDYRLEIPAGAQSVIRIGAAEAAIDETGAISSDAAVLQAQNTANMRLSQSDAIVAARADESKATFGGEVSEHEPLYRQALMSLLWNDAYYLWDGTSGVHPDYSGLVDAHEVLIMPDKWESPWLASWESAFHAVTASLIDPQLAEDQLRFVLSDSWEQPDGHIPCAEWIMPDECPPIFAWAAWHVYEQSHDVQFLEDIYPGLQNNYDFWWAHNMVGDSLFTGGSLGMDNLPRGGRGAAQSDATAWMALFARDMARIASEVHDPQTSERYWVDRGKIQEAINSQLWDDTSGFYYDQTPSGSFIYQKSYTGLIPLIAGIVPPERVPRILSALRDENQFLSVGGIRSMSADASLYIPGTAGHGVNSNWRGPVWVPINHMLIEALRDDDPRLAEDIRNRVVDNVEADWQATSRLHEFFDGDTGKGLGADEQAGWTALVANLIRDGWPATGP